MTAGIVGLGLIGGSFAKAYRAAGHTVLAANRTESVLRFAELSGDVAGELTDDRLCECDIILLCTYPESVSTVITQTAGVDGSGLEGVAQGVHRKQRGHTALIAKVILELTACELGA